MNKLVAPQEVFRKALRRVISERGRSMEWPVGLSRYNNTVELIMAPASSGLRQTLRIVLTDDFAAPRWLSLDCAGLLLVGRESRRGMAAGYIPQGPENLEPLDCIYIVGPGMHRIPLQTASSSPDLTPESVDPDSRIRWSRTIGVLGPVWHRLINLHFALIGTGRTGSVLARLLLRIGVRRLTLVDPDVLELFNLGEADDCLSESQIGRPKVDVLADALRLLYPWADIQPISESVTHIRSLQAVKACDILLCCTDHDSARLAATCAAALFCRPLLDVGTGITRRPFSRMGASIRLILPGQCLMCTGGLRVTEAQQVLRSSTTEQTFRTSRDWHQERMGSLASLNYLAAALAQRMIEDLLAERIQDTTWLQLEFDQRGRIEITYPPLPPTTDASHCRVCSALAGRGDEGLAEVPRLIHNSDRLFTERPN